MPRRPRWSPHGLLLLAALTSACASPVSVSPATSREVQRYLTQSALSSDQASPFSLIELRRYELLQPFYEDPDATLDRLHELALRMGLPAEALFALAELSYLRAEQSGDQGRYAAAAIYAWAFLFPEEAREPLDPLDPRSRIAADLYNCALASAFRRKQDRTLMIAPHPSIDLPFGHFSGEIAEPPALGGYAIESLLPAVELKVTGFRNRYRRAGIGAPLAATLLPTAASEDQPVPLGPNAYMPLTAVVRVEDPLAQIRSREVSGRLELYASLDVDAIEIAGRQVALEAEPTAAIAAGLSTSRFWEKEMQVFLGNALGVRRQAGIAALRPYRKGRIPAVFVHGTASSPARWADMVNDLLADPRLRHRYAFWFFAYDSGQPIAYSAWQLRDALTRAVDRADPEGLDPCLRDMIVLGHSQGGLLTKMTAIDSGDMFWRGISSEPLEETRFSEEDQQLLRNVLFVEPLPFVRRLIFLATPHRGSYLAGPQLVSRLAQRLVRLPSDLVRVGADLAALAPSGALTGERLPTSIDNMSPNNRFIRELAQVPVSPDVTVHSIIAVDDDRALEDSGDGVVKFQSSHIDAVASELIVHSPHSGMQAAPQTIEEVRRIFLEHAAASACPTPPSTS